MRQGGARVASRAHHARNGMCRTLHHLRTAAAASYGRKAAPSLQLRRAPDFTSTVTREGVRLCRTSTQADVLTRASLSLPLHQV